VIIVHHLENSRSQRVLWLLEELGLQYEVKRYNRDSKTMLAPPELRAVHPLGKSPVITDGDRVIAESGAIIEYLVRKYDPAHQFHPVAGSDDELDFSYWLHYAEGSLMPLLVMKLIFNHIQRAPMPFFVKPVAKGISGKTLQSFIQPNLDTHLEFVENRMRGRQWFVGDSFSAADVQMTFPLEAAAARDNLATKYPSLQAFLQRVHERPAYRRALERGGPYALMS